MIWGVLVLAVGLSGSKDVFKPAESLHSISVSAGGLYGSNEYGTYGQGYVSGEVSGGPGFFPVVGGVKVGGPWVSGQKPYQFWFGICGECYQKWVKHYTDRLLGGEALINRYKMLSLEVSRLDSLLSLVDTSGLRRQMEMRLSLGDTLGFDSLRRLYDRYMLLYRRYSYAKGLLEKIPMDTSLLRVRGDVPEVGSLLRLQGRLPSVTTFVERVKMLRLGRFQPTLMPTTLMFPMWLEGLENSMGINKSLSVGFYAGRITTLPYGIDSARKYWSGGLKLDIKKRYKVGGYGILSDYERQYVGYVGVYGNISRFVYDVNVFRAMYERLGPSYILVRDGVEDSVSGRWRASHSGFWGSVGYGSKKVSVDLSGSYYGKGKLLLLPNLPALIGTWRLRVMMRGKVWRPSFEIGQLYLPDAMKYKLGVRVSLSKGSVGAVALYRSYVNGLGDVGTHIAMVQGSLSGFISPSAFIRYQNHSGNLEVWAGGLSISFSTGKFSHVLSGSYQLLRWLIPVEWSSVQRQYEGRYSMMVQLSQLGIGPYVWYYSNEWVVSGIVRQIVGGVQLSYPTSWGLSFRLWGGVGPYYTNKTKVVRFDSGIQIGWQWERQ